MMKKKTSLEKRGFMVTDIAAIRTRFGNFVERRKSEIPPIFLQDAACIKKNVVGCYERASESHETSNNVYITCVTLSIFYI